MLRDHEFSRSPYPIDITKTTTVPVPESWQRFVATDTVEVLPLVDDHDKRYDSGWCTYVYEHVQAPELELLSGGVNAKTPAAGAIWRQGHLLHFGFQQSPDELNENGRALLANAIVYISRFTEDRPIVRTPCVFAADGKRITDRHVVDRVLNNNRDLAVFEYFLAPSTYGLIKDQSREEVAQWYDSVRGYMHADENGKLLVDEEARSFGVSPAAADFLPQAIRALEEGGERSRLARLLLDRYVADGPGPSAAAEEWQRYWRENQPYLFFSDTADFKWLIDPLAKSRGIASQDLRGAQRSTLPGPPPVR